MLIKIAPREEGTEVTEVVKWIGDKVFYLQTVVGDPGARQLHSLLLGSGQSQCLSCNTQEMLPKLRNRPKCQFVSTSMSKVTMEKLGKIWLKHNGSSIREAPTTWWTAMGPGFPTLVFTQQPQILSWRWHFYHQQRCKASKVWLKRCGRQTAALKIAIEWLTLQLSSGRRWQWLAHSKRLRCSDMPSNDIWRRSSVYHIPVGLKEKIKKSFLRWCCTFLLGTNRGQNCQCLLRCTEGLASRRFFALRYVSATIWSTSIPPSFSWLKMVSLSDIQGWQAVARV